MIKVLGLGDNVVDVYTHTGTMYPGGNALNFAVYASFFGVADSAYLGAFGSDAAAAHVKATALELGIDLLHCRYYEGENGHAKVSLQDGDRVFQGGNQGGVVKNYPLSFSSLELAYINEFDIVHTSIFSYVEQSLPILREHTRFLSMDFSDRADDDYYVRCVPHIDCACVSCGDADDEEVIALIDKLLTLGCSMVIATRGAKGAVVHAGGRLYRQAPCLVKAIDTMGAGDSFIASFLVGYATGMQGAVDFPPESGTGGLTSAKAFEDLLIQTSLYRAAVFSAENCRKEGAFGFGVPAQL